MGSSLMITAMGIMAVTPINLGNATNVTDQ